jgi:predicted anti-sigma-YlaC factor YlaD
MMSRSACRAFHDLVEESAYGLLDGPEHAAELVRLEGHLTGCSDCRDRLERECSITESLNATSRIRVSVSMEDRVMTAVRAESARRAANPGLSQKQRAALGGVAAAGVFGETLFWAALVLVVTKLPVPAGLSSVAGTIPEICRPAVTMAQSALAVVMALGHAWTTVLRGLALLLPSPPVVAVLFVSLVSILTVIAVRRDLQRSPAAARGLR